MLIKEKRAIFGDKWTAEEVSVTPEMAEEWLTRRAPNRKLSAARARKFALMMQRGEWKTTPQGIVFDQQDRLMDGQTRLQGVIFYGQPVTFIVYRGVDYDLFTAFDGGTNRSLGDLLHTKGEINATALAAAINVAWALPLMYGMKKPVLRPPSREQALKFLENNSGIRESVKVGGRVNNHVGLAPRLHAGVHYNLSMIDDQDAAEDCDWFFEHLMSGADLPEAHPVFQLRKTFLGWTAEQKIISIPDNRILAFHIRAWNYYRSGDDLKSLRWRQGGAHPESFPTPI